MEKRLYNSYKNKFPWAINAQGPQWTGDHFASELLLKIGMFNDCVQVKVGRAYTSIELTQLTLDNQTICEDCVDILIHSLTGNFEDLSFSFFDFTSFLQLEMEESATEHLLSVAGEQAVSSLLEFEQQIVQLPSINISLCDREENWTTSMNMNINPWNLTTMYLSCQSRYQKNLSARNLADKQFKWIRRLISSLQVQVN